MTATQESPTASYADLTTSLAPTYFNNHSGVGSGSFVVTTEKGGAAIYDEEVIVRFVRGSHEHTGADMRQAMRDYFVCGHSRHAVELKGSVAAPIVPHAKPAYTSEGLLAPAEVSATASTAAVLSVSDILRLIRTSFGLTVTQIASVMLVERVTIYAWMESNAMDSIRQQSRERLKALHGIASTWSSKRPLYGKFLHEQLTDGKCIFDFLTAPVLDPAAFVQAYDALVEIKNPDKRRSDQVRLQRESNKVIGVALKDAFKNFGS